jgi:asparagine synthase (glutamine-hydrolysing)
MDTLFRRPSKGSPDGRGVAMEKYILRQAFEEGGYLPYDVLYRKKEAFSDGVSSAETKWYEVSEDPAIDLTTMASYHNPPKTQEAYRYRQRFNEVYGDAMASVIPRMWMPRWIEGATDPSARTLTGIYHV